jgi:hypothetical protein
VFFELDIEFVELAVDSLAECVELVVEHACGELAVEHADLAVEAVNHVQPPGEGKRRAEGPGERQ